jgi:threonine/homoserine/homoserine lactone efflux protein
MDALLSLPQFSAFLAAAILITLAPGPDNLMVLSLGMARGPGPGVAFGFGCALGCLNHTVLAALGISALIAASPPAFAALRIAGGLYLIWLGIQAIRHARAIGHPRAGAASTEGAGRLFTKGLVANAINPKVILFFLAFLPQFVDNARGHAGWQIAQLGIVFTLQAALIFSAIGWFAGGIGVRLARTPGLAAWLNRVSGGVFVLIGAKLIAAG